MLQSYINNATEVADELLHKFIIGASSCQVRQFYFRPPHIISRQRVPAMEGRIEHLGKQNGRMRALVFNRSAQPDHAIEIADSHASNLGLAIVFGVNCCIESHDIA